MCSIRKTILVLVLICMSSVMNVIAQPKSIKRQIDEIQKTKTTLYITVTENSIEAARSKAKQMLIDKVLGNFRIVDDANNDGAASAGEISAGFTTTGTISGSNIIFSGLSLSSYITQGSSKNFLIIGDGGAKKILQTEITRLEITNIIVKNPVSRIELQDIYTNADYLFLHLNDYPAFRKVLPSKIFELATFKKTILAGVSGYSAKFINDEITNSFVFNPCDYNALVNYLQNKEDTYSIDRSQFVNKFQRSNINKEIASSILSYL